MDALKELFKNPSSCPHYHITIKREGCQNDWLVQTCGIDWEFYLTVESGERIKDLCEKMEGVTITYKTKRPDRYYLNWAPRDMSREEFLLESYEVAYDCDS